MSPGLVVAILLGSSAIAVVLLVLLRRRPDGWWADPGRASGVLGAARSPLAVILAFVILVAFQGFTAARTAASDEAAATRTMFKTARYLAPADRDRLQGHLICYARAVIYLDWPAMRHARGDRRVDDLAGSMEDVLRGIRATDAVEQTALTDILSEANAAEHARDQRLAEANGRVPGPVWIVLWFGAVGVLAYVLLFADPREKLIPQGVMVTSVTVIVVGGMLLVWFLSHPYLGQMGSLAPTDMHRTLTEIQTDPSFAEGGLETPCDLKGRPLGGAVSGAPSHPA